MPPKRTKIKSLTWTNFKSVIAAKNLVVNWKRTSLGYDIGANFGALLYSTFIFTDLTGLSPSEAATHATDRIDFENNYKLDVNANIIGGDRIHNSQKLRYDQMAKNQIISNSSYTTIYSYSGKGLFFGFYIDTEKEENLLKVVIDSTEVILEDFEVEELEEGDEGSGTGAFIWPTKDQKHINCVFPEPISYMEKIEIQLKGDDNDKKLRWGFVSLTKEG